MTVSNSPHITVLGGGPAGLAAGYYARKNDLPFTIFESTNQIGGNTRTLNHGEFFFDMGAHRLHDKIPEVTRELLDLLGNDLKKIHVPSQIFHQGKFINFPLSPLNLLFNLGPVIFANACFDLLNSRLTSKGSTENFEQFAIEKYGDTIASNFLLNYSKKLWGLPCDRLSPSISGNRIKGLSLRTFLKEMFLGKQAKTEHLDGSFYYPTGGYGLIAKKLGQACGEKNIRKQCRITKVLNNNGEIFAVEINDQEKITTDWVVSTLPIPTFLQIMDPAPPKEILDLAQELRFRDIKLVTLFIQKETITPNASVYFPEPQFPFTRVVEPRNRCPSMSPPGKTSLVAEIPCQKRSPLWQMDDSSLTQMVQSKLIEIGWVKPEQVIDAVVSHVANAYPVLDVGSDEIISRILKYLEQFKNLRISGRNGKFTYTHLHDMLQFGKIAINDIQAAHF